MADEAALLDRNGLGSPYLNSGKQSPKPGKSSHISTIKSLGLLHDLKDYICNVEMVAAEQKRELERVREEKRDIEKAVYKIQHADSPVYADFAESALQDMPPKLRAVFEENKVLREKLKKYKYANRDLDDEVTKRGNQLLVMEDAVTALKKQLQMCAVTPEDALSQDELRQQIASRDGRIRELEDDCTVLQHKIDVDAKLARQERAQVAREREAFKQQLAAAAEQLDEKDKLYRAALLEARKLARRLAPTKPTLYSAGGTSLLSGNDTWDSAAEGPSMSTGGSRASTAGGQMPGGVQGEAASGQLPQAAAAAGAGDAEPPEARVHLMLVVLKDEHHNPVPAPVSEPAPEPVSELAPEPLPVTAMLEPEAVLASQAEASVAPVPEVGCKAGETAASAANDAAAGEELAPVALTSTEAAVSEGEVPQPEPSVDTLQAPVSEPMPAPAPEQPCPVGPKPEPSAALAADGETLGRSLSRISNTSGNSHTSHTSTPKAVPYSRTQARAEARQQGRQQGAVAGEGAGVGSPTRALPNKQSSAAGAAARHEAGSTGVAESPAPAHRSGQTSVADAPSLAGSTGPEVPAPSSPDYEAAGAAPVSDPQGPGDGMGAPVEDTLQAAPVNDSSTETGTAAAGELQQEREQQEQLPALEPEGPATEAQAAAMAAPEGMGAGGEQDVVPPQAAVLPAPVVEAGAATATASDATTDNSSLPQEAACEDIAMAAPAPDSEVPGPGDGALSGSANAASAPSSEARADLCADPVPDIEVQPPEAARDLDPCAKPGPQAQDDVETKAPETVQGPALAAGEASMSALSFVAAHDADAAGEEAASSLACAEGAHVAPAEAPVEAPEETGPQAPAEALAEAPAQAGAEAGAEASPAVEQSVAPLQGEHSRVATAVAELDGSLETDQ